MRFYFSASGSWEEIEQFVEGAGGNPPFDPKFVGDVLVAFERLVRRESPYCRCVLPPLSKRYGVLDHIRTISSEGVVLVSMAAGALPF